MLDVDKIKNPVKTAEARRAELRDKMGLTDEYE